MAARAASTARVNHSSQASRLRPRSSMPRASSGWRESASQAAARAAGRKAQYAQAAVAAAQKAKSAME